MNTTPRRPPTAAEVVAQQKRDADAARQAAKPSTAVATTLPPQVPAVPDTRSAMDFLDEVAGGGIVGRRIKFNKNGEYELPDTGDILGDADDYAALCAETLSGWIKFNGKGEPPITDMGLLYGNPPFVPPLRSTMGDDDESTWELGLDGKPDDPWKLQMYLVLQHTASHEMFTFVTSSKTGRRAVGNLLKHYNRMPPGFYPVVRLKKGGFQHRDDRVGWVATPAFAVVGKSPKDGSPTPANTAVSADLNDQIPF